MRAFSDNEDLALLSGVNPDRIVLITWIQVATTKSLSFTLSTTAPSVIFLIKYYTVYKLLV